MASRVNLGPLTTTFTPASACLNLVQPTKISLCSTCIFGYAGQDCTSGMNYDNPDCWPPRSYSDQATPSIGLYGWGYYSPGIHCPAGYTTACSSSSSAGDFSFEFPPINSETAIGCCPTGYECATINSNTQTCLAIVTSSSFTVYTCSNSASATLAAFSVPSDGLSSASIYAPMIQLIRDADDLSAYVSATTTADSATATDASASAGGTAETIASATATASNTGSLRPSRPSGPRPSGSFVPFSSEQSSLSAGAKIGIAVGVVAGVVMLVAMVFYMFRMRRRMKQMGEKIELDTQPQSPGVMPGGPPIFYKSSKVADMYYGEAQDMYGGRGGTQLHELPVTSRSVYSNMSRDSYPVPPATSPVASPISYVQSDQASTHMPSAAQPAYFPRGSAPHELQ